MQKLCLPKKVYFKAGSYKVALRELTEIYHIKSALIVTSAAEYVDGAGVKVMRYLENLGIRTSEFFIDEKDVTIDILKQSQTVLQEFEPEAVVAVGNETIMGAGKIIRLLGMNTKLSVEEVLLNLEGRSRGIKNKEVYSVMIPTTFATGDQNTPFAQVKDQNTLYYYSNIELLADISITDIELVKNFESEQIYAEGNVLMEKCKIALEKETCSPYVAGFLKEAIHMIEMNQMAAVNGSYAALEQLHNAGSIAGNALGNL